MVQYFPSKRSFNFGSWFFKCIEMYWKYKIHFCKYSSLSLRVAVFDGSISRAWPLYKELARVIWQRCRWDLRMLFLKPWRRHVKDNFSEEDCYIQTKVQALKKFSNQKYNFAFLHNKQASQQGTIFGVATQHLLHLAADRRVYLMLILHLRVSSSDSSEVERLASILGDPRSIPPISKNIFVGNWAWFGLAILLSNSASSQNKAPCWEVWFALFFFVNFNRFEAFFLTFYQLSG